MKATDTHQSCETPDSEIIAVADLASRSSNRPERLNDNKYQVVASDPLHSSLMSLVQQNRKGSAESIDFKVNNWSDDKRSNIN